MTVYLKKKMKSNNSIIKKMCDRFNRETQTGDNVIQ